MKVKVRLFATLRKDRFDENEFEIDSACDVDFLLKKFSLKQQEVAIIFINGRHGDYKTVLNNGDEIALFPPIGGG